MITENSSACFWLLMGTAIFIPGVLFTVVGLVEQVLPKLNQDQLTLVPAQMQILSIQNITTTCGPWQCTELIFTTGFQITNTTFYQINTSPTYCLFHDIACEFNEWKTINSSLSSVCYDPTNPYNTVSTNCQESESTCSGSCLVVFTFGIIFLVLAFISYAISICYCIDRKLKDQMKTSITSDNINDEITLSTRKLSDSKEEISKTKIQIV